LLPQQLAVLQKPSSCMPNLNIEIANEGKKYARLHILLNGTNWSDEKKSMLECFTSLVSQGFLVGCT